MFVQSLTQSRANQPDHRRDFRLRGVAVVPQLLHAASPQLAVYNTRARRGGCAPTAVVRPRVPHRVRRQVTPMCRSGVLFFSSQDTRGAQLLQPAGAAWSGSYRWYHCCSLGSKTCTALLGCGGGMPTLPLQQADRDVEMGVPQWREQRTRFVMLPPLLFCSTSSAC